ncbi:MAG: hypothetical protein WCO25_01875 [Candidatus Uhrbacteria bacterium]
MDRGRFRIYPGGRSPIRKPILDPVKHGELREQRDAIVWMARARAFYVTIFTVPLAIGVETGVMMLVMGRMFESEGETRLALSAPFGLVLVLNLWNFVHTNRELRPIDAEIARLEQS